MGSIILPNPAAEPTTTLYLMVSGPPELLDRARRDSAPDGQLIQRTGGRAIEYLLGAHGADLAIVLRAFDFSAGAAAAWTRHWWDPVHHVGLALPWDRKAAVRVRCVAIGDNGFGAAFDSATEPRYGEAAYIGAGKAHLLLFGERNPALDEKQREFEAEVERRDAEQKERDRQRRRKHVLDHGVYRMSRALISTAPKPGPRSVEQRVAAAWLLVDAYRQAQMGADALAEIRADLEQWEATRDARCPPPAT